MANVQVDVLKYALARYDDQIDIELNLISARMTWLVISQSFLFGTFVAGANIEPRAFGYAVQALVSVVGLLSSVWVRTGIEAALRVVDRRKDERRPVLESLSAELVIALPAVHRADREHQDGNTPTRRIPTLLAIVWVTFMLLWAVRIGWHYLR
jgi:hypothetical protein